ncbi:MAG: HlyD family secretion protein [Bacillota bacterium]
MLSLDAAPTAKADPATAGTIRLPGQVQPKTKVSISATVSLTVMELPFKEGDRVTKGGVQDSAPFPASVLVRLGDSDLKAALRAAEAKRDAQAAEIEAAQLRLTALESQVASSRVSVGEAERSWGRFKKLIDTESVSQAAADEAHSKLDRLRAEHDAAIRGYEANKANLSVDRKNLMAAEAEVDRARLALAAATISSPIDGVITRVNVKVGEVVTGTVQNPGTVLMEVADMDHLVLVARADEDLVSKVKAGQKTIMHLKGYGSEIFTGTVQSVALTSTEAKDGSRYFRTEISLDTAGQVIPAGLSGEAEIEYKVPDTRR